MSEWVIVPALVSTPRRELCRQFTPNARMEVPFGRDGQVLLGLHVYQWIEGPITEDTDNSLLTKMMIAKTREALAAMEASLESSDQVGFPAEIDPVAALERKP